ncbi:hypothetical protein SK128_005627 [Halocaridina rubra]|uniref:Uncharacterized protein n=1 Tax=Halocaridina rubra TaxID=373956 RepID=A0AAN9AGJ4_HALRR
MGIGRGWAGIIFLFLLATCISNTPIPNPPKRPHFRHGNISLSRTPTSTPRPHSPLKNYPTYYNKSTPMTHDPVVVNTRDSSPNSKNSQSSSFSSSPSSSSSSSTSSTRPRNKVQYTIDLLASPISGESVFEEDTLKITSHITVEAQLLPWGVDTTVSGRGGCIDIAVATRAAHLALQRQPPPAGVSLVIVPPPTDDFDATRHEMTLHSVDPTKVEELVGAFDSN